MKFPSVFLLSITIKKFSLEICKIMFSRRNLQVAGFQFLKGQSTSFSNFTNLNAIGSKDKETIPEKHTYSYQKLFPFNTFEEFSEYLTGLIVYKKEGLYALNKPFGIKIYGHDKPGTWAAKSGQRYMIPMIKDCDYTVEDALPHLSRYLEVPSLKILKSAERYTSGLVLLSANDKVSKAVVKSFNVAKTNLKKPHLTHWMITLGYPAVQSRNERVGIRFLEDEKWSYKQPIIETKFSERSVKLKKIKPVIADYRIISTSRNIPTSLVEISTNSVAHHFIRVYASNRIATILGDIMYSNRMNMLLGVPVQIPLQNIQGFDMQPLPDKIATCIGLPKGVLGHQLMPTMLHLRSIYLPKFNGQDLTIVADLPNHFQWTMDKLNLLPS